jgi:putative transposase
MLDEKIFYKRHLPHYQPPFGTYLLTFRLADSLPISVISDLKHRLRVDEEKTKRNWNIKNT